MVRGCAWILSWSYRKLRDTGWRAFSQFCWEEAPAGRYMTNLLDRAAKRAAQCEFAVSFDETLEPAALDCLREQSGIDQTQPLEDLLHRARLSLVVKLTSARKAQGVSYAGHRSLVLVNLQLE